MYKIILFFIISGIVYSQNNFDNAFNEALLFRGLTRSDVTIPLDTADHANTNQSNQILPITYQLMTEPLRSFEFMDKVMSYKDMNLNNIVTNLYKDAGYNYNYSFQDNTAGNNLTDIIQSYMKVSRNNYSDMSKALEKSEIKYILDNLTMLNENPEPGSENNTDIYKLNAEQDSGTVITKRILDLLSLIDKSKLYTCGYSDFIFFYTLFQKIKNGELKADNKENSLTKIEYPDGFTILIGTNNNDHYIGNYDMIIDPGGNDTYELSRNYSSENYPCCIIDLSGDDLYITKSKYSVAGSIFTSSFIFDNSGNDVYRLSSCNLASTVAGFSMLYDGGGNDFYEGKDFSVAAALFGCALLYDMEGNDIYSANTFSQGFGMTNGIGAIVDLKGNDNYVVNPTTLDVLRYTDHYLSMCQGYGYGLRPYYAGGIGYIIEGEGNDVYQCDIFGQGGSYWYALGCILDYKGNDKYAGFHYNQGSGIHLSVGLLKDSEGWDYYNSNWVSQGCGHDYAVGILWDVKGSDLYACDGLSQGAGNANGIGILIDESGRDGYLSKDLNTQGYGSPSRGFGSIGILLDNSGNDYYSQRNDSTLTGKSNWGVKYDNDLPEPVIQTQNSDFKLPVDTTKSYTMDELYMFARTMEIQFQNYSAFAFNRLVNDSVNTTKYILSKLNSDNIIDVVLIRNLVTRIGWTMSNEFTGRIEEYIKGNVKLTEDELIFMVFLAGESKNPASKETLFNLLSDRRYRVRSSAITALSKLNYSPDNKTFEDKIFKKLAELLNENSDKQLYNKDLTLALRIFTIDKSAPELIKLLDNNYFGVRFNASDILKSYGDKSVNYILKYLETNNNIIPLSPVSDIMTGFSNETFKQIYKKINVHKYSDKKIAYAILKDMLMKKKRNTTDKDFINWIDDEIKKAVR